MEIEEMKNGWDDLNKRIQKQEIHTKKIIDKMTQEKYESKLNKISKSEYVGTLVCYLGASYLGINFTKIDDLAMKVFAIVAVGILFLLPILSLKSIRAMKFKNLHNTSYIESIKEFAVKKRKFLKLQKINISLGLFLFLILIPVLGAIQGKSISQNPYFWPIIFPIGIVFFISFSYWVLKSYNGVLLQTEKTLLELEN